MKLILTPDHNFVLIANDGRQLMTGIHCQVTAFSRTYTHDPIPAEGFWTARQTAESTWVYGCDNYQIETKSADKGLFLRARFTNTTSEELTRLSYFQVVRGAWHTSIDRCLYNEIDESPFKLPTTMSNPVRTVQLIPEQSVKGTDLIVARDQAEAHGLFGFVSAEMYFNELSLNQAGQLCAAQLLENRSLNPGDQLSSDWFFIGCYDDANEGLQAYGTFLGSYGKVDRLPEIPTGWCTWYYYLMNIDQDEIALNLKVLADQRRKLPVQYIQIDDGWYDHSGDWMENDQFSRKMKNIAASIKAEGYLPGIWLCPFLVSGQSRLFHEHPEYLVQNNKGEPQRIGMTGDNYALDTTHPGAAAYLRQVIARLSRDWGFRYIKLDYVISVLLPGQRHQANTSTLQALRAGFQAIRAGATADTFILACTSPLAPAVGLVDGMRISVDIGADWTALKEVCNRVLKRYYFHQNAYLNDADCLIIRKKENEDERCMRLCVRNDTEIETYMTVMAASGGLVMLSDKMPLLTDKQIDLLARLFPINTRAAIPLDILEQDCPGILEFGLYGSMRIVALINWSDKEKQMSIAIDRGHVYDFWRGTYHGVQAGQFSEWVEPHAVRLLFITPEASAVVIGTDCCLCPEIKQSCDQSRLSFNPIKPGSSYLVYAIQQPQRISGGSFERAGDHIYKITTDQSGSTCHMAF